MKTDLFHCCVHCWVFQICWHIECNTFTASSFRIWNSSTGIPSPPLAFWAQKNWCFWTVVLEKTLESPLECKQIQPVHPKGVQSWVFIGRTDVEAETPILWPLEVKSWLIGRDPDAGRDCGQEEKGTTEGEMVGWHPWLNGHGFGWTLGVVDGQGGLVCCDSWAPRVGQNWVTELN